MHTDNIQNKMSLSPQLKVKVFFLFFVFAFFFLVCMKETFLKTYHPRSSMQKE